MLSFEGMPVIVDPNCLADTSERLFPFSKHRSARVRKKLIKRFGGEFRKEPAIFRMGNRIVAHPVMAQQLKQQLNGSAQTSY